MLAVTATSGIPCHVPDLAQMLIVGAHLRGSSGRSQSAAMQAKERVSATQQRHTDAHMTPSPWQHSSTPFGEPCLWRPWPPQHLPRRAPAPPLRHARCSLHQCRQTHRCFAAAAAADGKQGSRPGKAARAGQQESQRTLGAWLPGLGSRSKTQVREHSSAAKEHSEGLQLWASRGPGARKERAEWCRPPSRN